MWWFGYFKYNGKTIDVEELIWKMHGMKLHHALQYLT